MENKILVKLYIPIIELNYELLIPVNKSINELIQLIGPSLTDMTGGHYQHNLTERIYNRETGQEYEINQLVKDTNIRNGTELVLM